MKYIKDIALILLCGLCLWLLIKPDEPENLPSIKQLEVEGKKFENVIRKTETKIIEKQLNNQILENKINDLTLDLEQAKEARDTIIIIKVQDTIINTLKASNDTLKTIIGLKDSIISNKDSIIKGKDEIIQVQVTEIVKFKRQRNVLGTVAAALVGLFVLK